MVWRTIVRVIQAVKWRPGFVGNTFRAEIVGLQVSEGATREEAVQLLAGASQQAAERYFAALDAEQVHFDASDVDRPFPSPPSTGFDEEFIARRPCFLEYVAEGRPGFLFSFAVLRDRSIEEARQERVLAACGCIAFSLAVRGYLCGCRPEADALVAQAHEWLTLAESIPEKSAGDMGSGWGLGQRSIALADVHWLRTGETHDHAVSEATRRLLIYYRRAKHLDRRTANLASPSLLFRGDPRRTMAGTSREPRTRFSTCAKGSDAPATKFGCDNRRGGLAGVGRVE